MSFCAYKRKSDGKVFYAFPSDAIKRLPVEGINDSISPRTKDWLFYTQFEVLPPNPTTILATSTYMAGVPYLDSLKTMYELDRQLNIEAEQAREDKVYQQMVLQM